MDTVYIYNKNFMYFKAVPSHLPIKDTMDPMLHNYDSQMQSVLFWLISEINIHLYILAPSTRQQCNQMHYVLTRWRSTIHVIRLLFAGCLWMGIFKTDLYDHYSLSVNFCFSVKRDIQLNSQPPVQNHLSEMPTSNNAVCQCWHKRRDMVTCDVMQSFCR